MSVAEASCRQMLILLVRDGCSMHWHDAQRKGYTRVFLVIVFLLVYTGVTCASLTVSFSAFRVWAKHDLPKHSDRALVY